MSTENTKNTKTSRDQELGALWLKKSKAGASFLSGYVLDENKQKVQIVVFKNGFKKDGESSPDYRIYMSENRLQTTTAEAVIAPPATNVEDQASTDDIPF
jgi:uncharacterized protein (DUF736 family)